MNGCERQEVTFHNNCTSSIEGYYAGIFNIFNFSEEEKYGASEEFKEILVPLGIKISIKKAKDVLKITEINFKENLSL